ncbi:MAG: CYTH domain-containing protein [Desulfomonilia bacterium]
MAKEIERKFLVDMERLQPHGRGVDIRQGFIPTEGHTVVRIRITGEEAYLTIKGKSTGPVRSEFEYPIPVSEASEMLNELCERPFIDKTRYSLNFSGNTWEVDVFHGENEGLVIAEIELRSEDQAIDLPPWVSREVTGDPRYFNVHLVKHPYTTW